MESFYEKLDTAEKAYEQLLADGYSDISIYNSSVKDLLDEGVESEEIVYELYEICQGKLEHYIEPWF